MFNKTKLMAAATAFAMMGTASLAETVSITAVDQAVSGNSVLATRAFTQEPGWLVLYSVKSEDGDGFAEVGDVLGYSWVDEGVNENIFVRSEVDIKQGDRVVLMLHTDATGDVEKEFEYKMDMEKDGPFALEGRVTMVVIGAE